MAGRTLALGVYTQARLHHAQAFVVELACAMNGLSLVLVQGLRKLRMMAEASCLDGLVLPA
jgi:hypothetical protein